jgi:hypothetical protein
MTVICWLSEIYFAIFCLWIQNHLEISWYCETSLMWCLLPKVYGKSQPVLFHAFVFMLNSSAFTLSQSFYQYYAMSVSLNHCFSTSDSCLKPSFLRNRRLLLDSSHWFRTKELIWLQVYSFSMCKLWTKYLLKKNLIHSFQRWLLQCHK